MIVSIFLVLPLTVNKYQIPNLKWHLTESSENIENPFVPMSLAAYVQNVYPQLHGNGRNECINLCTKLYTSVKSIL